MDGNSGFTCEHVGSSSSCCTTDNCGTSTCYAESFNQPLNDWNVSNVTDMEGMFQGASSFNQPLNNWDVSNVTDMSLP